MWNKTRNFIYGTWNEVIGKGVRNQKFDHEIEDEVLNIVYGTWNKIFI